MPSSAMAQREESNTADKTIGRITSPETLRLIEKARGLRLAFDHIIEEQGKNDKAMWLAIKNELGISDRYFGTIPMSLRTTGGDSEVTIDADAEPPGFLESYIEQTKAYDCPKSPTNQHEYAVGSGICVFCERKFTKD